MILVAVVACMWVLGFVVLYRIPSCRAEPLTEPHPSLSIIIPARDEAANLPRLLKSIADDAFVPLEVLVVDDGSTDNTAALAREHGATVLTSQPLPDGWRGKTWACHQGAAVARGDILLFVDADTFFEPGGLHRVYDTYLQTRNVMSVAAYHKVERVYEELSAFFNIMMTIGVGAFTILGRRRQAAGLFGPFLMLDRASYDQVGGHASVRDAILENMFMARRFKDRRVPTRCYGGRGVFSVRMYPHGLRDLINGWSKAFAAGASRTSPAVLLLAIGWMSGAIIAALLTPHALVHGGTSVVWICVYGLFALQLALMLMRLGAFRFFTAVVYPVPLVFFLIVFLRSSLLAASGSSVEWKGRQVPGAGGGRGDE